MKLVKSKDFQVKETTKTFYEDEKDTLVNNIDFNNFEKKDIELIEPLNKKKVQELWSIRNIEDKKIQMIETLNSLKYLKSKHFHKKIDVTFNIDDLDTIIADIVLYTEGYVSEYNKKELEKANPSSIDE